MEAVVMVVVVVAASGKENASSNGFGGKDCVFLLVEKAPMSSKEVLMESNFEEEEEGEEEGTVKLGADSKAPVAKASSKDAKSSSVCLVVILAAAPPSFGAACIGGAENSTSKSASVAAWEALDGDNSKDTSPPKSEAAVTTGRVPGDFSDCFSHTTPEPPSNGASKSAVKLKAAASVEAPAATFSSGAPPSAWSEVAGRVDSSLAGPPLVSTSNFFSSLVTISPASSTTSSIFPISPISSG